MGTESAKRFSVLFSFASRGSSFRWFPYSRLDRLLARLRPYWDRLTDGSVLIKSLLMIFDDRTIAQIIPMDFYIYSIVKGISIRSFRLYQYCGNDTDYREDPNN